jgi:hypothetical protein
MGSIKFQLKKEKISKVTKFVLQHFKFLFELTCNTIKTYLTFNL